MYHKCDIIVPVMEKITGMCTYIIYRIRYVVLTYICTVDLYVCMYVHTYVKCTLQILLINSTSWLVVYVRTTNYVFIHTKKGTDS